MKDIADHRRRVYDCITDLIGSPDNPTPIVMLNPRMNPYPEFQIGVKLERFNIFGSIKDRVALSMIRETEVGAGQTLLEASSGNTGLALAAIANAIGLLTEVAVPERIPEEKKVLLRLLGIDTLWEAEDELCPLFPNEGHGGWQKGWRKASHTKAGTSI